MTIGLSVGICEVYRSQSEIPGIVLPPGWLPWAWCGRRFNANIPLVRSHALIDKVRIEMEMEAICSNFELPKCDLPSHKICETSLALKM